MAKSSTDGDLYAPRSLTDDGMTPLRDYSLPGADGQRAVQAGLVAVEWYHTDVARKDMKAVMRRSDRPAIRDTALWLGLMVVFAGIGIALWPSWTPIVRFGQG